MEILVVGFGMAAISYFSKRADVILTAIAVVPFIFALLVGIIHVMNNSSSFQSAFNSMITAITSYFMGYIIGLPGAALFDVVKSIF